MRLKIIVTVLLCCLLPVATRAELPLDDLALYMSFDDIQGNKVMDGSETVSYTHLTLPTKRIV